MKRQEFRKARDYVSLIILIIQAMALTYIVATSSLTWTWRNVVALIFTALTVGAFLWQHKAGVLLAGATLILGLFGVLSFIPGLRSITFNITVNRLQGEFWFQPDFLLWLTIHFALSGRHYVGILTRQYWVDLSARIAEVRGRKEINR